MLALATVLLAALTPKPALSPAMFVPCPSAPAVTIVTTAHTCPALEISGRVDADGAEIDPAFAASVAPGDLTRFGRGDAILTGYAADGRTLFIMPVATDGPFHYYVPLSPQYEQSLNRLTLVSGNTTAERTAVPHGEPSAEAIGVDDGHILVAWDARAFPAIRVSTSPGATPIAFGGGTSTFEQFTVETAARRVFVEFSDGLHTFSRSYNIFGR